MAAAPETPSDSPLTMEDAIASPVYRDLSTPELSVGDLAFTFELPKLDRSGIVRLAVYLGVKPVALVFGSYT